MRRKNLAHVPSWQMKIEWGFKSEKINQSSSPLAPALKSQKRDCTHHSCSFSSTLIHVPDNI